MSSATALIEKSDKNCNRNGHKVVKVQEAGVGVGVRVSYGLQTCLPPSQEIEFYTAEKYLLLRGQNPCLTYWEIGGNVCPVNIGDVEAAGDIKRGGLTARKEPPLRLLR